MTKQEEFIRAEISDLEAQLEPLQAAVDERRERLLEVLSPFAVGDIITWQAGGVNKSRKGRVIELGWWVGDPKWKVRRIKNDGTFGAECWIFPYYKPEKVV